MSLDPFIFSGARGDELDNAANYGVEPLVPLSSNLSNNLDEQKNIPQQPVDQEESIDLTDPTVYVRDPFWFKKPAGQRPVEDAKALFLENLLKNKEATITRFHPNGESFQTPLHNRDGTPSRFLYEYVEKANTFFNVANQDPEAGVRMDYDTGRIVSKDYGNKIMSEEFVKGFNPFSKLGTYLSEINATGDLPRWEEYVEMVNADSKSENSMIDPENKDLARIFNQQAAISLHDFSLIPDPIQKVQGEWHVNPGALLDIEGTDAAIDANKELSKYEKIMLKLNRDQMIESAGYSAIKRFTATDGDLQEDLLNYMNSSTANMKGFVLENKERLDSKNYGLVSQLFETTITAAAMIPGGVAALGAVGLEKLGAKDWADKLAVIPSYVAYYHDAKMAAYDNNDLFDLWGARFRTRDFTELFGQVASFGGIGGIGALGAKTATKLGAKELTRYGAKYQALVAANAANAANAAMRNASIGQKMTNFGKEVLKDQTAYLGAMQASGMVFGSEFNAQIAAGATRDEAMHKASIGAVANGLSAFIATGVMNRFGFGAEAAAQPNATAQSIFAQIRARGISKEGREAVIQLMRDLNASEAVRRQVAKSIVSSMDNAAKKLGLKGFGGIEGIISEGIEEAADEVIGDFLTAVLDHSENWNDEVWGNINEKFQDYFKAGVLGLFGGLGGEGLSFTGQALSGRSRYFKGDTAAVKAFRDKWKRFELNVDEFQELRTASGTTSSDGAMTVAEVLASDKLTDEEKAASIVDAAISRYSTVADREVDIDAEKDQPLSTGQEAPLEAPQEPLPDSAGQEPVEANREAAKPSTGQPTPTTATETKAPPADPRIQSAIAPKLAEAGIKELSGKVPYEFDEKNNQKGKNGETVTPIHIGASGRNLAARITYKDGSEIIASAEEASRIISTQKKSARQQKLKFQNAAKRKLTKDEREQWAETKASDGASAKSKSPVSEGAGDAGVPQGDISPKTPVDSGTQPTSSDQPIPSDKGVEAKPGSETVVAFSYKDSNGVTRYAYGTSEADARSRAGLDDKAKMSKVSEFADTENQSDSVAGARGVVRLSEQAKKDGVDLTKMTREQYVAYAKKYGVYLDGDAIRMSPDSRVQDNVADALDAKNMKAQQGSKRFAANSAYDKMTTALKAIRNKAFDVGKALKSGYITALDHADGWVNFKIKGDANRAASNAQSVKPIKAYFDFGKKFASFLTESNIKALLLKLHEAGYNGQLKIGESSSQMSRLADQMVVHGATDADTQLAAKVIEEFFGSENVKTNFGRDAKGTSYSENLSEETRQTAGLKKEESTDSKQPEKQTLEQQSNAKKDAQEKQVDPRPTSQDFLQVTQGSLDVSTGAPTMKRHVRENKPEGAVGDNGLWLENEGEMVTQITMSPQYLADLKQKHNGDRGKMRDQYHKDLAAVVSTIAKEQGVSPSEIQLPSNNLKIDESGKVVLADNRVLRAATNEELNRETKEDVVDEIDLSGTLIVTERELKDSDKALKDTETDTDTALEGRRWVPTYKDNNTEKPPNGYRYRPSEGKTLLVAPGEQVIVKNSEGETTGALVFVEMVGGEYLFAFHSVQDLATSLASDSLNESGVPENWRESKLDALPDDVKQLIAETAKGRYGKIKREEKIKVVKEILKIISPYIRDSQINFTSKVSDQDLAYVHRDQIFINLDNFFAKIAEPYTGVVNPTQFSADVMAEDVGRRMAAILSEEVIHLHAVKIFTPDQLFLFYQDIVSLGEGNPLYEKMLNILKDRYPDKDTIDLPEEDRAIMESIAHEMLRSLVELRSKGETSEDAYYEALELSKALNMNRSVETTEQDGGAMAKIRAIGAMVARYARRIWRMLDTRNKMRLLSPESRRMLNALNADLKKYQVDIDVDKVKQNQLKQTQRRAERIDAEFINTIEARAGAFNEGIGMLRRIASIVKLPLSIEGMLRFDPERGLVLRDSVKDVLKTYPNPEIDLAEIQNALDGMNRAGFDEKPTGKGESSFAMAQNRLMAFYQVAESALENLDFDPTEFFNLLPADLESLEEGSEAGRIGLRSMSIFRAITNQKIGRGEVEGLLNALLDQRSLLLDDIDQLREERSAHSLQIIYNLDLTQWQDRNKIYRVARRLGLVDASQLTGDDIVMDALQVQNQVITHLKSAIASGDYSVPPIGAAETLTAYNEKLANLKNEVRQIEFSHATLEALLEVTGTNNTVSANKKIVSTILKSKELLKNVDETLIDNFVNQVLDTKNQIQPISDESYEQLLSYLQAQNRFNVESKMLFNRAIGDFGVDRKGFAQQFVPKDGSENIDDVPPAQSPNDVFSFNVHTDPAVLTEKAMMPGGAFPDRAPVRKEEYKTSEVAIRDAELKKAFDDERRRVESNAQYIGRLMKERALISEGLGQMPSSIREDYMMNGGFALEYTSGGDSGRLKYESEWEAFPRLEHSGAFGSALRGLFSDNKDAVPPSAEDLANIISLIDNIDPWINGIRKRIGQDAQLEIVDAGQIVQEETLAGRAKKLLVPVLNALMSEKGKPNGFVADIKQRIDAHFTKGQQKELIANPEAYGEKYANRIEVFFAEVDGQYNAVIKPKYNAFRDLLKQANQSVSLTRESLRAFRDPRWERNIIRDIERKERDPSYVTENPRVEALGDAAFDFRLYRNASFIVNYFSKDNPMYFDAFFAKDILRSHPNMGEGYELSLPAGSLRPSVSSDEEIELYKQKVNERKTRGLETPADMLIRIYGDQTIYVRPYDPKQDNQPGAAPLDAEYVTFSDINAEVSRGASATGMVSEETGGLGGGMQRVMVNRNREDQMFGSTDILGSPMLESSNTVLAVMNDLLPAAPFDQDTSLRSTAAEMAARNFGDPEVRRKLWWTTTAMFIGSRDGDGNIDLESARNYLNMGSRLKRGDYDRDLPSTHSDSYSGAYNTFVMHTMRGLFPRMEESQYNLLVKSFYRQFGKSGMTNEGVDVETLILDAAQFKMKFEQDQLRFERDKLSDNITMAFRSAMAPLTASIDASGIEGSDIAYLESVDPKFRESMVTALDNYKELVDTARDSERFLEESGINPENIKSELDSGRLPSGFDLESQMEIASFLNWLRLQPRDSELVDVQTLDADSLVDGGFNSNGEVGIATSNPAIDALLQNPVKNYALRNGNNVSQRTIVFMPSEMTMNAFKLVNRKPMFIEGIGGLPNIIFAPQVQSEADSQAGVKLMLEKQILQSSRRSEAIANEVSSLASKIREAMDIAVNAQIISSQADLDILELAEQHQKQIRAGRSVDKSILDEFPEFNTLSGDERMIMKLWVKELYETGILYHPGGGYENVKKKYKDLQRVKESKTIVNRGLLDQIRYNDSSDEASLLYLKINKTLRRRLNSYRKQRKTLKDASVNNVTAMDRRYRELAEKVIDQDPNYSKLTGDDRQIAISILNMHYQRTRTLLDRGEIETGVWSEESDARLIAEVMTNKTAREIFDAGYLGQETLAATGLSETSQFAIRSGISQILSPLSQGDARSIDRLQQWQQDSLMARQEEPMEISAEEFTNVSNYEALKELMSSQEMGKSFSQSTYNTFVTLTALQKKTTPEKLLSNLPADRLLPSDVALINAFNAIIGEAKQLNGETTEAQRIKSVERDQRDSEDKYAELLEQRNDAAGPIWSTENTRPTFTTDAFPKSWYLGSARLFNIPRASGTTMPTTVFNKRRIAEISANIYGNIESISNRVEESRNNGQARRLFEKALKRVKSGRIESVNEYKGGMILDVAISNNLLREMEEKNPASDIQNVLNDIRNVYAQMESDYDSLKKELIDLNNKRDHLSKDSGWIFRDRLLADKKSEANKRIDQLLNDLVELKKAKGDQFSDTDSKLFKSRLNRIKKDLAEDRKSLASIGLEELTTQAERHSDSVRSRVAEDVYNFLQNIVLPSPELSRKMDDAQMNVAYHWGSTMANDKIVGDYLVVMGRIRRKIKNNFLRITQRREAGQDEVALAKDNEVLQKSISNYNAYVNLMNTRINELMDEVYARSGIRTKPDYKALHMRKVVLSGDQSANYESLDQAFNDSLRRTTVEGTRAEAASVLMAGNRGLLNSFVRERLAEYLPKAKLKSPSDRKAAAIRRGYFANNLRNMLYDSIGNPNSKTEIENAIYNLVVVSENADLEFESAENARIYEASKEIMNEFVLNTAEIKSLIHDRIEDLEGNTNSQAKTASQLRLMREADEKIKETENEINQLETAMLHKWGREPESYNVDPETLREIRESLRTKQTARYYHRFSNMYELDERGNPLEGSSQDFEASVYINFVPEFKGDKTMADFAPEVRNEIDKKWHEDESLRKEHIARLEALESSAQMISEESVDDIYKALRGTKEFVKTYDPRRLYGRAIDLVKAADAAMKNALEEERESYVKLMAEGLARETDPDIGGRLAQLNYALEGEAPSVKSLRLPKDLRDRSSYLGRLLTDVDGSNPILLIPKDAKQALIETFPSITSANVNKEMKDLVLFHKTPSAKNSTADRKRGGFMNFRNKEWKDRPLGNNWKRLIDPDFSDEVITADDNLADLLKNVKTRREAATLISNRLEEGILGYYNARRKVANNQTEVEDVSQIEDVKRSLDLAKDMIEKIVYAIDHEAITENGLIDIAKTLKAIANPSFSKTMNGTASNLDQLIINLNLTKSFSKAFSLVEGSRIMKKLTAGLVAFNPANELFPMARIKAMELFHHQDARTRMRFARKQSAIQTAVELQAFLEEGFNGASGRDAAISITKERQEKIARSGKKLGNSSINHSIAYVIAQLEGLKDAQDMTTYEALESWYETMESGIHDSTVLKEVQQDEYNFITRFFKAQAIDTVRQLPAAEKIMQILKSSGIESVNKLTANELRQEKAEKLIEKAKKALLEYVKNNSKINESYVKEHADTIYGELRNLYHGMNVTRAIFSNDGGQTSGDLQMVPVNEESKREVVSPFMRSYGSVPLRRIHAANPSVESRLAPEGRYITDPEEMLSLKDSHFYSGLGRQDYDRGVDEQAVLRPINVDGVNSPISIIEDSVYRMNVQPNYQIIRQMVGRTVLKNGVPRIEAQQFNTAQGAIGVLKPIMPDLLSDDIYANEQALARKNKDGSALRALHEMRMDYSKAMAAVASEIENTIQNDSQVGVINTDFSNQMRRASSLFVVRALASVSQLWNQGVGPAIGYMIKKIAVGDWAAATEFASILAELFKSAVATVPIEFYNRVTGKVDWRRKDGLWRETTNFIKRTSPYTFYRAAEGHDIVRASERNQIRYKGNRVRNVASKVANLFETVGEGALQVTIGSPERLLARAMYIVELRQQLRKYDGDSSLANLSLEELVQKEAKDIPVYAKQYARIKVTDMMGQSDEAKKSWFFQNRSKNPLESAFYRNVARFSNHTATTASNMSAMIPTIFMGTFDKSRAADAESRKEAIENAVGTLSQNFLFHILKWNTIVPLAVWAWQSMFGDDDDEDPMMVANRVSKDIFGTEDDGMIKTAIKELTWVNTAL
jgi:hypothetical protein